MKRYQIVLLLVVACVPLALALYKKSHVVDHPMLLGATWSVTGDPKNSDLQIKVYAVKPDSCFGDPKVRVKYDEKSATIIVAPELTKGKGGTGTCTPNVPYMSEGVLHNVPEGSYKLQIIGSGRILTGDVSLPSQGALPPNFTPSPSMAQGG